jgi:hypothetical protein
MHLLQRNICASFVQGGRVLLSPFLNITCLTNFDISDGHELQLAAEALVALSSFLQND